MWTPSFCDGVLFKKKGVPFVGEEFIGRAQRLYGSENAKGDRGYRSRLSDKIKFLHGG